MKKIVPILVVVGVMVAAAAAWVFMSPAPSYAVSAGDKVQYHWERFQLALPFGSKDGRTVLKHAYAKSEELKSGKLDASITGEVLDEGGKKIISGTLTADGPFSGYDAANPQNSKFNYLLTGSTALDGIEVSFSADMLWNGITLFYKLNEVPAMLPVPPDMMDTWIQLPEEQFQIDENEDISAEKREKIMQYSRELIAESEIKAAVAEEKNGMSVWTVEVVMSSESVFNYIDKIDKNISENPSSERSRTEMKKSFEKLSPVVMKISVDPSTMQVVGMSTEIVVDVSEYTNTSKQQMGSARVAAMRSQGDFEAQLLDATKVRVVLDASVMEINQPQTIETPADAQTLEELMMNSSGSPRGMMY